MIIKKLTAALIIVLSAFIASACSTTSKQSTQKQVERSSVDVHKAGKANPTSNDLHASFKNGVFKTDLFELKIDRTQVGHDNFNQSDGLIVWYSVTNKTKTKEYKPSDIFRYLKFTQSDGNSDFSLDDMSSSFSIEEALYPMYDKDKNPITDQDDAYNKAVDAQNSMKDNEEAIANANVLPRKTAKTVAGIQIKNTKYPVKIKAYTSEDEPAVNGEYEIDVH